MYFLKNVSVAGFFFSVSKIASHKYNNVIRSNTTGKFVRKQKF